MQEKQNTFFHKQTDWNDLPLELPGLKFNNSILERATELRFLDVMADGNLN